MSKEYPALSKRFNHTIHDTSYIHSHSRKETNWKLYWLDVDGSVVGNISESYHGIKLMDVVRLPVTLRIAGSFKTLKIAFGHEKVCCRYPYEMIHSYAIKCIQNI